MEGAGKPLGLATVIVSDVLYCHAKKLSIISASEDRTMSSEILLPSVAVSERDTIDIRPGLAAISHSVLRCGQASLVGSSAAQHCWLGRFL